MKYDFDTVIDRKNTDSLKYDFAAERQKPEDLIPMWVADMDFAAPPEVLEDIENAVRHGIFGYTEVKEPYYKAVSDWFARFDYFARREDIVKTPGVVFALAMAVRAFTNPGDAVIIQTPVYYPFFDVIRDNGRKLVKNPLKYENGSYAIDFDGFEREIKNSDAKLFLLCSPHNPVGRVWKRDELERLNEICVRHGVLTVSDEIHCDFIWTGHKHTCFGTVNKDSVIAAAPSKTFNLAGLHTANVFIKNGELRDKFKAEIAGCGISQLNLIGLKACLSAYTKGGEWLSQLREYLEENINCARSFLNQELPRVKLIKPEGTYLLWLDFSDYNLSRDGLDSLVTRKAKLWVDPGEMFGDDGRGFLRINIACPRVLLKEALTRLAAAFG